MEFPDHLIIFPHSTMCHHGPQAESEFPIVS